MRSEQVCERPKPIVNTACSDPHDRLGSERTLEMRFTTGLTRLTPAARMSQPGRLVPRRVPASVGSQITQHFVQNATVAVVFDFDGRVDAANRREPHRAAVRLVCRDLDGLPRLQ